MTIYLKNSVFIHIPKTGGVWVRECLNRHAECEDRDHPHHTPDLDKESGVFAFVRHPASWLRSLFVHRMSKGKFFGKQRWGNWNTKSELEKECASNNFHVFIKNICNHKGVITKYFDHFLHKYREPSERLFIGKQENLCVDLSAALTKFNEVFDKESIIKLGKVKIHFNRHHKNTVLSEKERHRLYESQQEFYSMYDYKP